jgi:hypothetical protein
MYYYGARWSPGRPPGTGDPAAGRFIQADSVVPSQNQNTEASKRIQLLLIVDYHELNLLTQLGIMYRDELLKEAVPGGERSWGKGQSTPKPTNTDPLEADKRDDTYYTNSANQALVNFNELRDIGKVQTTVPEDDKAQRSKGLVEVDMMPSRMNSLSLDRFAYTSNCPTKYTDPSGHCSLGHIIIAAAFLALGSTFVIGAYLCMAGSVPTLQIEIAGLCALIGAVGGSLGFLGGYAILVKDGCLPNFMGLDI